MFPRTSSWNFCVSRNASSGAAASTNGVATKRNCWPNSRAGCCRSRRCFITGRSCSGRSRISSISICSGCSIIFFTPAIIVCQSSTTGCKNGTAAWPIYNSNPSLVKNYVLDTNVLLHDPNCILNFHENNVLIPIEVLEEIDHFKRESTELGQNARTVSRALDGLRGQGRLSEGVKLQNGGSLRIIFEKPGNNGHGDGFILRDNTVDSRIVSLALGIQKSHPKQPTILVSKDINLRLKADAL